MLLPGDPAPLFTVASSVNPRFNFDTVAGRYVVLSFLASSELPFSRRLLAEVAERLDRFDVANTVFFGVSIDPDDRNRLKQQWPGVMYFWDLDLAVSRRYGAAVEGQPGDAGARHADAAPQTPDAAVPASPPVPTGGTTVPAALVGGAGGGKVVYRPQTVVLDQALRVLAIVGFGEDPAAHLSEVLRMIDQLPGAERLDGPAPVLTIPYVFEPDLCRTLMEYYDTHGGQDSGFMRDVNGKTVAVMDYRHKRRMDCEIEDQSLIRATQERLARRVIPAIRQAFQFNASRIERHIVACYDAADGGHFRAHRDNTTLGTAHRRFALTMNLNSSEFEGGELNFPEFGRRLYKPPSGGVVVFSCSLLHEARPVTLGRRYAFLPFLYDDAAARVREHNRHHLAGGPQVQSGADQPAPTDSGEASLSRVSSPE